ncbi:class I adenylate-forming enzyme family protein [Actinokineospora bangkokensis]|uniref:Long-chain acyl-CoA synthetase n=1 Tax=Actinokineospora bangkokensis TaxID=1193682 RepID=A0A1Q9LGZ9_9PSEU|nr:class I adenylate-forming enzyme family protein [Actinokineospora bangkokensis]OLR91296.1 long-chain acyl-CoA synthetase [Actinokineospora bangkokensis]
MKVPPLATLFDDLVARGTRTVVHLDRPFDLAPLHGTRHDLPALAALVRRTAGALHTAGVAEGDVVAVVKANHWDYVLLAAAIARLGAVPALLSDHLPPESLEVLLTRLAPAALVTTRAVLAAGDRRGVDLTGLVGCAIGIDGEHAGAVALAALRGDPPPLPVPRDPDAPLVVNHTSGTTGVPKLVVHTTRTLLAGIADAEATRLPVVTARPADVVCSAIAYAHGRAVPWTAAVLTRGPRELVVIADPDSAEPALRAHPPTTLEALPATYVRWHHLTGPGGPFAGVRLFVNTFDAVHPPTVRAFLAASARRYPVWLQVWGQTETGPITFRLLTRRAVARPARRHPTTRDLGRPAPGRTRLRVVDPRTLSDLPPGTPGLLLVRTPGTCVGYLGEQDRWHAKWTGGWWNTGDLGVRTPLGTVRLLDREVDLIPGLSSVELEDVLEDRIPRARECVVLGTPGSPPTPVVVTDDGTLDPRAWVRAQHDLPALADPVVLTWDQVPRTGTGKVRRHELRRALHHGDATFGTGQWT